MTKVSQRNLTTQRFSLAEVCNLLLPKKAVATDQAPGDWSIVVRDDGSKQWAYGGKPVYRWIKDQKPGDKTGDGVNKVWHIASK